MTLRHGHYRASLIDASVITHLTTVFVLINDLIQGRDNTPWAAVNGHGDVLGEYLGGR